MATDKLFSVAGVSTVDGEAKVRFANDIMRIKVLAKHGHEDITLIELETPMTKLEAAKFIQGLDEFSSVVAQSAIADYLDRKDAAPKAAKAPKVAAPKAKAATAKAPKAKAAKAPAVDTSAMEDAPF